VRGAPNGSILEAPEGGCVEAALNILIVGNTRRAVSEPVRMLIARGLAPRIMSRSEASHA
jgi:hypothetical protein